jgi:diguanylate cyclase (GGDEF)-like protein
MSGDILNDIVAACLELERKAASVFRRFAADADGDAARRFWESVADETRHHSAVYERLRTAGENEPLPLIIYKPAETFEELEMIGKCIDEQVERYAEAPSPEAACLLAFRMQLYLLHPAFASLCRLTKDATGEDPADIGYGRYLRRFIDGIGSCGLATAETELLGEALFRLWNEARQLAAQSHFDALTGVMNRAGFFKAVGPLAHAAQRSGSNVGVMLIDLDYFKLVGDNYGHQTGDRILQLVAETITANLRRSDVVGRYDGDEFVAYLSPVDPASLRTVAENLRRSIEEESSRMVPVTASIGVAQGILGTDVERGLEELVRVADECLMQAKYTGKNKVVMK